MKSTTIDPVSHKLFLKEQKSSTPKKKNVHRYFLESKGEPRVKLPSLANTMTQLRGQTPQPPEQPSSS